MFDEAQRETLRAEINRILNEAVGALMDAGHLESGSVIVLGCSTSEITGARIGKGSVPELGEIVAEAMLAACKGHGVPVLRAPEPRNCGGEGDAEGTGTDAGARNSAAESGRQCTGGGVEEDGETRLGGEHSGGRGD